MEYWNLIGGTAATFTALAFIMLSFQKEGKYTFNDSVVSEVEIDDSLIYRSIVCILIFFLMPFCTSLVILSSINFVNYLDIYSMIVLGIFVLNLLYMSYTLFKNKILTIKVLLISNIILLIFINYLFFFTSFRIFLEVNSVISLVVAFIILFVLLFNFKTHLIIFKINDQFLTQLEKEKFKIEIGAADFEEKVKKFEKFFRERYKDQEISNLQTKKKSRINEMKRDVEKIKMECDSKVECLKVLKGKNINNKELHETGTLIKISLEKLFDYCNEFEFIDKV